jgi:hypothetical protein
MTNGLDSYVKLKQWGECFEEMDCNRDTSLSFAIARINMSLSFNMAIWLLKMRACPGVVNHGSEGLLHIILHCLSAHAPLAL